MYDSEVSKMKNQKMVVTSSERKEMKNNEVERKSKVENGTIMEIKKAGKKTKQKNTAF